MSQITNRKSKTNIPNDASEKKNENKYSENKSSTAVPKNKISLRVLSRIVVITSILIVVYFTSTDEKIKPFARQSESLVGKGQIVECSSDYVNDVVKYENCFPKECKRYVSDKIISEKEAEAMLKIAQRGFKLGGSSGGASILDLHSGALSLGEKFINIYKIPEGKQLFTEEDFNLYRVVKEKIKFAVAHHFGVDPSKLYLTHPTFYSRITSKKSVTVHDEYWHPHVDKETYKSFHYTTLLYLNNYNIDFQGGRFVFVDNKLNRTVEPRTGRVSMFTSGAENLHYVERVSSGIRYAITISFTCNEKYAIVDPSLNKYA